MTKSEQVLVEVDMMEVIDESADLIGSCFNFLQIETLEKNLVSLIPALLMLNSDNLTRATSGVLADASQTSVNLCLKYLKFLIKYLSLKQSEQYVEEITSFDLNEDANLLFDSDLKVSTDQASYLIDYKNLTILNLVKIVFKFKQPNAYKCLIGHFLNLAGVCLNADSSSSCESSEDITTFRYSRNAMYLWFNLVKKHFVDANILNAHELNLLIDYVYFCLNNLFSHTQRNFILFQMNLNADEQTVDFNKLMVFICLKNYLVLNELIQANKMVSLEGPLKKIYAFLFDFIFASSLMIENSTVGFEFSTAYFANELLLKQSSNQAVMDRLNKSLNEKIDEMYKPNDQVECVSEVLMLNFENYSNLVNTTSGKSLTVAELNVNLRISHLLYLALLVAKKVNIFILLLQIIQKILCFFFLSRMNILMLREILI